jgi:iron(III) transport system substrate-binding protein
MTYRFIALATAALSLFTHASQPFAAEPPKGTPAVAEMANYQGADREQKLLAAAKAEGGELNVYHVYPALTAVLNAFTSKYGIKVKAWRSGSEGVLQKVVSEARGNRFEADIVQNNAPENEAAHREKLLQPVNSPLQKDLMPEASPAHKEWVGITLDVFVAAYNTGKVKREELPKTYQDLLDPKWKGRLGIEADDSGWFGALAATMGEKETYKLFGDIIAKNGISVRKGHSLLANLVASGEVPLALTVYSWTPEQLKQKGAPIESDPIQPVMAQFSTIAMTRKAPHPYSALLLYDFMLGEGQKVLADQKFVPSSRKIESPITKVPLKFIDAAMALDHQDKWTKAFEEVVVRPAR